MINSSDLEVSGDVLSVRDSRLDVSATSPDELQDILGVGREAILGNIENRYLRAKKRNPEARVSRPSVYVMRLGGHAIKQTFTELGQRNDTNLHQIEEELQQPLRPYWQSVKNTDFIPEVRSNLKGRSETEGTWLLLRHPETQDHLSLQWTARMLGFIRSDEMVEIEGQIEKPRNPAARKDELLAEFRQLGERVVESHPAETYAHAQVGLILACAEAKRVAGRKAAAREELDDAMLYAQNLITEVDWDPVEHTLLQQINNA